MPPIDLKPYIDSGRQDIFEKLQAAEGVAERLRALTGSLGPDFLSTQFYTRIRVKTYDSIIKKIYKKRFEGKLLYSIDDLDDLVGVRIVTLYDRELMKALLHVFQLIESSSRFTEPLFENHGNRGRVWDHIREIKIYRRPKSDDGTEEYNEIYQALLKMIAKA